MIANNPGALLNQWITATTTLAALESGTTDALTKVAISVPGSAGKGGAVLSAALVGESGHAADDRRGDVDGGSV